MPRYDYVCSSCGDKNEEFFPISEFAEVRTCPGCGEPHYELQVNREVKTDMKPFHTAIDLYSIAMEDVGEIRDFKRRCPDVICSDDPRDEMYGVPQAPSRKAKLQALAAAGYVETK